MAVIGFHEGIDGVEEPDWAALIPDVQAPPDGSTGQMARWRELAHRHWLRVCQELRETGTFSAVNGHQVQRLVMAYVRYDLAAARMMSMEPVLAAPKTGTPMVNLWQVEMRQADADATTAEMELCLTPRRRGAATKAARKERKVSAASSFLGQKSA